MSDDLPIDSSLKTLDKFELFKTDKWWSAVALVDSFGRKQVAVCLWLKKGDNWKSQQKFVIRNKDHWLEVKEVVEKFVEHLP